MQYLYEKNALSAYSVISSYISLLRPHQYVKNLFIFAPVFFDGKFTSKPLLINSFIAFVIFSLASSSVYIFNDYHDRAEDMKHPVKKFRPLASGAISPLRALLAGVLLLIVSLSSAFAFNMALFIIMAAYVLLNVFYSIGLKHISLLDIFIIAVGFIVRLIAGSVVTDIRLSMWIVVMTFLLALFLAIAKRRDDVALANQQLNVRKSIDGYNLELINGAMIILASVIMVSYLMYTLSPEITSRLHSEHVYATSIFVLFGILRYMQITLVEGRSGSPTKVLLKDLSLQITILLWILSFVILLYR